MNRISHVVPRRLNRESEEQPTQSSCEVPRVDIDVLLLPLFFIEGLGHCIGRREDNPCRDGLGWDIGDRGYVLLALPTAHYMYKVRGGGSGHAD